MKTLNEVVCTVNLNHAKGWHLVNEEAFYAQLTKETTAHLRSMGLNVVACVPGRIEGLGAGPGALFNLISALIKWEPLITFLLSMSSFIVGAYLKIIRSKHRRQKQSIKISLSMTHSERLEDDDTLDYLPSTVAVAFDAGIIEQRRLADKYPLYNVELVVSVYIPKNGFSASYYVNNSRQLELRGYRLGQIVRALNFAGGNNLHVSFSKFGSIQHSFYQTKEIQKSPLGPHDWRCTPELKNRTYYTYISSKMLGGYKRNSKIISWEDFEKSTMPDR